METPPVVGIVGGGFSATALAVALARYGPGPPPVVIERASAGRGIPYRTRLPVHRLNVPAGRMSAEAGDPDGFVRWLRRRDPAAGPDTFASRGDYGDYLAELLAGSGARVVAGEVVAIERTPRGFSLGLGDGRRIGVETCVLAPGHRPPALPRELAGLRGDERLREDPWAPGALERFPPGPILLLGTGLTAVDAVLAARESGHPGPVHALSRHGLLPRAHRLPIRARPVRIPERPTVRGLLAGLRDTAAREGDWRPAVDALRPHARELWRALPHEERRRFLRHARSYWDAHRHRMAPEVAERIGRLQATGYLAVHAGRILGAETEAEGGLLRIRWRRRGGGEETLRAATVIACTGPAFRDGGSGEPWLASLLAAGLAVPDPLGLGIRTDETGALLDRHGSPAGLFALGPLRIPAEWESTAAAELREQAAALAERIVSLRVNR